MGQRVSKRELAENERMRQERNGTLGLVQCEGCPTPNLVPDGPGPYDGLCGQHGFETRTTAHAAELRADWDDN